LYLSYGGSHILIIIFPKRNKSKSQFTPSTPSYLATTEMPILWI
jgi:hypothetical protein